MKKLWVLALMLCACTFLLAGCNKSSEEVIKEDTPAVQPSEEELAMWDLIKIIETHFPKAYNYSKFDIAKNESLWDDLHIYSRMEVGYLTPENEHMIDRVVTSSGMQDDMIYNTMKATMDDGRTIDVVYVINPETLDFVAANVEDGDIVTNYQFIYDDVTALRLVDLESDAESNFPLSYTYTNVDLATEESTTWDFLYHEDTPNNLANITPDFAPISESKFLSSGIEDGMIYTNFDVVFEDWTTGNVLYINDPETLNFVAATVESQGHSINYQYAY